MLTDVLEHIYRQALAQIDPERAVREALRDRGWRGPVTLLAAGKAAVPMARACLAHLGASCSGGVLVTKDGHLGEAADQLAPLQCFEAAHPLPNQAGVEATQRFLEVAKAAQGEVLFALSGGASALLVAPLDGLSLQRFQEIQQHLLRSGADIEELNTVRKHLSRIKGGQLAQALGPARCLTLILSDVVGSPLDAIASGPTVPDTTTVADCRRVAEKYGLSMVHWTETPKEGNPCFENMEAVVVGDHRSFENAATRAAQDLGWRVRHLAKPLTQEVLVTASMLALEADLLEPGTLLLGSGETTVKVTGNGLGGRAQQLALAMALRLRGRPDLAFLAGASDGTDGPTDAAGGVVDGATVAAGRKLGLDANEFLQRCDAYHFLEQTGCLLKTGPTGTNVNDLVLLGRGPADTGKSQEA